MEQNKFQRIILASDHSGVEVKEAIIKHLEDKCQLIDLGPFDSSISVDYPNYAIDCAKKAVELKCLGIVVCGTGIGVSIAANKVKGARCTLIYNNDVAKLAKIHNNANVLAFGARQFDIEQILGMIDAFLGSTYEGSRHQKRLDIISNFESEK